MGLRLALVPLRLALVPLRLLGLILGRITGGRPWLALVLVLGCGVIFLHASTLKTNQVIAEQDVQIGALERSTATLRNDVAELGSTDRVGRIGRENGMVFPDPEGIGYLDARTADASRAAKVFGPPSPTWRPAPNPSVQNGDVLNPDGTVATPGTVAAAGSETAGTTASDGTTGETTSGAGTATSTGGETSSASSGATTGEGESSTTGTATGTDGSQSPSSVAPSETAAPATESSPSGDSTGATGDATSTGGVTPSGP